jgi:hypothetical protein
MALENSVGSPGTGRQAHTEGLGGLSCPGGEVLPKLEEEEEDAAAACAAQEEMGLAPSL